MCIPTACELWPLARTNEHFPESFRASWPYSRDRRVRRAQTACVPWYLRRARPRRRFSLATQASPATLPRIRAIVFARWDPTHLAIPGIGIPLSARAAPRVPAPKPCRTAQGTAVRNPLKREPPVAHPCLRLPSTGRFHAWHPDSPRVAQGLGRLHPARKESACWPRSAETDGASCHLTLRSVSSHSPGPQRPWQCPALRPECDRKRCATKNTDAAANGGDPAHEVQSAGMPPREVANRCLYGSPESATIGSRQPGKPRFPESWFPSDRRQTAELRLAPRNTPLPESR